MPNTEIRVVVTPAGLTTYEAPIDDVTKVIYFDSKRESPSFIVGFICNGAWYYQGMHWSCRGAKFKYFRALASLYRYLRRQGITEHSLRFLAWGENRLKNGGFAICKHRIPMTA